MKKQHVVKVYSTTMCPWCIRVKEFLKKHKVKFEELNVEEDADALMEMIEKSGQRGVPVLDIDGKIITGFDEEEISSALGL